MEGEVSDKNSWCFECHKNANGTQKCANCSRHFHPRCNSKTDQEREREIEKWNYHKANFLKTLSDPARRTGNQVERSVTRSPAELENSESSSSHCYACTLLEKGRQFPEAALSAEEINYLLKFTIARVITWVTEDEVWGAKAIQQKVAAQGYTLLEELLVDILDMAHHTALEEGRKYRIVP